MTRQTIATSNRRSAIQICTRMLPPRGNLCAIKRIEVSLTRFGDKFAEQFCTQQEILQPSSSHSPARDYALVFALKEAFSKAIGTGFNDQMWWQEIQVTLKPKWSANFSLSDAAVAQLEQQFGPETRCKVHATVAYRKSVAVAFVILEKLKY